VGNVELSGQYAVTYFLIEPDGKKTPLPRCSSDWSRSAWWVIACLHDPVGPICRRHKRYFKYRKEIENDKRSRSA
jgi:hypothetical protein